MTGTAPIDKFVGTRLREAREARGRTQAEVSRATGISANILAAYETGERCARPEHLLALADVYAVRLSQLFPKSGDDFGALKH